MSLESEQAERRVVSALRSGEPVVVQLPATGEVVSLCDVSPDQTTFRFTISINGRHHATTTGVGVAVVLFLQLVGWQVVMEQVK